jgi:hypothetical protein
MMIITIIIAIRIVSMIINLDLVPQSDPSYQIQVFGVWFPNNNKNKNINNINNNIKLV